MSETCGLIQAPREEQNLCFCPPSMDANNLSMLWYRRSKPQGKVRRRVQDVRIPSSSSYEFIISRPTLDLSHNESARLAADSLLSRGLEGYQEVLGAEGEVDFLSEPEKVYILKNGRDGSPADPSASDDYDDEFTAGFESATRCAAASTDSDPNMADVRRTDRVLNKSSVEIHFQSDSRAAGMKDLIREFIRKATMALAIVMDSFSDVELLCDLLEASRKRNVSVHLLLDHLNLNLFVSMWQDLKLNSKDFPKLSVRSVDGQTYCAKTGRKLTGQVSESFIIADWTEVLTGSYSFSWLSWQVHRGLVVLMKGCSVTSFHLEFHRLYSSSKPVPGFVAYITLPLHTTSQAAQNDNIDVSQLQSSQTKTECISAQNEEAQNTHTKAKMLVSSSPPRAELELGDGNTQPLHRAGTVTKTHEKPPHLLSKPLVQPATLQSESVAKPKQTVEAGCTQHSVQTNVDPLGKNQNQVPSHSNPRIQTHISYVKSQLTSLTITTTVEKEARVYDSNLIHTASPAHTQHRTVHYQSPFKTSSNLDYHDVGPDGVFFQQRNRDRLVEPFGAAAGLNTKRRQWNCTLNLKPQVDFLSDHSKVLSPSSTQQKQAKAGLQFPLTQTRGQSSGLHTQVSSQGAQRQDQPQRHHQAPLQSHSTVEAPKSAPTVPGPHLQPQLQADSRLFSPGTGPRPHLQPHTSQQLRLNWTPQNPSARPTPVIRHSSFRTTYGMGQQACGQVGWRPFHTSMNTSLSRSKSMTDRNSAGFLTPK